jgi:hypothetical protein
VDISFSVFTLGIRSGAVARSYARSCSRNHAGSLLRPSTYTIRLNHRHKLLGHVLSGRYKAQLVEGSGNGYLRTACDYVHLNPVRAGLLGGDDRLLACPWSRFAYYLAAPGRRPAWMRVPAGRHENNNSRLPNSGAPRDLKADAR